MRNIAKNSITIFKIVIVISAITIFLFFSELISFTVIAIEIAFAIIALIITSIFRKLR